MTRARNLGKLANTNTLSADNVNNFVGIASTQPSTRLNVVGVVSATSFSGDGSSLTGVASTENIITGTAATFNNVVKVGTAITLDATSGIITAVNGFVGNVTGNATGLSGTPDITVRNVTGVAATFTGVLTYEDVTNIDSLGIITARSDVSISDKIIHTGDTNTAIRFPAADTFTVETAGSEAFRVDSSQRFFVNQTSNVGSTAKLEVTGTLNNTYPEYSYPIMSVDDAAYDSSSGPGGGIGFAFKYTNGGAYAQAGGIRGFKENTTDNNYDASMAFYTRANGGAPTEKLRITSTGGVHFNNAELNERVNIVANKLSAVPNVSLDNGMVHYYTTNETTTATPNIISTAGINTNMATGDTMSVTILSKPNSAGYFPKVSIDGVATGITTYWSGGSAPSSAESSGVDVNVYQIIKTADATYDVLANTSNFA